MDEADANRLLDFVDRSQGIARNAVRVTSKAGQTPREHADRLLAHWRREVAPLVAIPAAGGALTASVAEVVAASFQGLFVVSLCELVGQADRPFRVDLVARLVCDDTLPDGWTAPAVGTTPTTPPRVPSNPIWRRLAQRAPDDIVAVILEINAVRSLTDHRPSGKLLHRVARNVPGIATVGAAFGERAALSGIAQRAYDVLHL